MKKSQIKQILEARAKSRRVAMLTGLDEDFQQLLSFDDLNDSDPTHSLIKQAFRDDRCQLVDTPNGRAFIQVYNTPLRLMIIGAVHIAQPMIEIARTCGYEITLIDPRRAFATPERFPTVTIVHSWPDTALRNENLDQRCAVVTLTHDPKLDEPALEVALKSDVFYIGALGSRRTHEQRCSRLKEAGWSDVELAKIHAPVGLDIKAKTPAEIAVSIVSEMTQALRSAKIK